MLAMLPHKSLFRMGTLVDAGIVMWTRRTISLLSTSCGKVCMQPRKHFWISKNRSAAHAILIEKFETLVAGDKQLNLISQSDVSGIRVQN